MLTLGGRKLGTVNVKTISETLRSSEISLISEIRTMVFAEILGILKILDTLRIRGIHLLENRMLAITTRTTLSIFDLHRRNLLQVISHLPATVKRVLDKFPRVAIELPTVPGACLQPWPPFRSRTLERTAFPSRKSLILHHHLVVIKTKRLIIRKRLSLV